eukprot:CAMPEP_0177638212 /NCGR_PEP_ID=MMETSP0447-20121125/5370_1 /TAXON_ID=0 /ORGANISM="Stygamoeba regulata, Strain BSH-02190019" /LENGTH=185 /DNA_ID=CAMNT_0019140163 /DNA_START=128 /DNA_END=685 /DNA_ORIENTATION=-
MSYLHRFLQRKKRPDLVETFTQWKIFKGDKVKVLAGKDKGKTGTVTRVLRKKNKVIVGEVNLARKHVKGGPESKGGIYAIEKPLHVSNVALVDPVDGKPTRVGIKFTEEGRKVRVSKRTGGVIPVEKPERKKRIAGPKDTAPDDVLKCTFNELEMIPQYFRERYSAWKEVQAAEKSPDTMESAAQ